MAPRRNPFLQKGSGWGCQRSLRSARQYLSRVKIAPALGFSWTNHFHHSGVVPRGIKLKSLIKINHFNQDCVTFVLASVKSSEAPNPAPLNPSPQSSLSPLDPQHPKPFPDLTVLNPSLLLTPKLKPLTAKPGTLKAQFRRTLTF